MEPICMRVYMRVYIVKLPPDTLPLWRQLGWRQCYLRPTFFEYRASLNQVKTSAQGTQSTLPHRLVFSRLERLRLIIRMRIN